MSATVAPLKGILQRMIDFHKFGKALMFINLRALGIALSAGPRATIHYLRRVSEVPAFRVDELRLVRHNDFTRAFPAPAPLNIVGAGMYDGGVSMSERITLAQLVRFFQPRRIVEVGTFRGETTRLLIENAPEDARVWTIDLPEDVRDAKTVLHSSDSRLIRARNVGIVYRELGLNDRVTQIFGDSQSPETWADVPADVDFAFIDASHSYEAVKADTENLLPRLKPDAVIAWHDYSAEDSAERGVGRYLRQMMDEWQGLFVISENSLALRIPVDLIRSQAELVKTYFPEGEYRRRRPEGAFAWLGV